MFLKNKNIIFKIRRPKVTDYAALTILRPTKIQLRQDIPLYIYGGVKGYYFQIYTVFLSLMSKQCRSFLCALSINKTSC